MAAKRINSDPFDHERFKPWHKSRAQANFRNEGWELTFEEYCEFWTKDNWLKKGRGSLDLVLLRKDRNMPWSKDNCYIGTRTEQLQRTGRERGSFSK